MQQALIDSNLVNRCYRTAAMRITRPAMLPNQGFTFIEVMVVLAIIVIIASIAAPSMQALLAGNRLISVSNTLVGAMSYARSEAVTVNQSVSVCSSADQTSCGGSWADGAVVLRADNTVLRVLPALPGDVTVAGDTVQFNADGQLPALTTLAVRSDDAQSARTVRITRIGQATVVAAEYTSP